MLKGFYKYKWMIGAGAVIIAVLGWFIKTGMKEAVAPLAEQMTAGFHQVYGELSDIRGQVIANGDQGQSNKEEIKQIGGYQQNTLRVEVKDNDQSKVSKTEFWKTEQANKEDNAAEHKDLEDRMNVIEIGGDVKGKVTADAH